jgi:hypothetical protein
MKIEVDWKYPHGQVKKVEINDEIWILHGECSRCGGCCKDCQHSGFETINGKKVSRCKIMWKKPAHCILYPRDPYDKLPKNCSYRWEKLDG